MSDNLCNFCTSKSQTETVVEHKQHIMCYSKQIFRFKVKQITEENTILD